MTDAWNVVVAIEIAPTIGAVQPHAVATNELDGLSVEHRRTRTERVAVALGKGPSELVRH